MVVIATIVVANRTTIVSYRAIIAIIITMTTIKSARFFRRKVRKWPEEVSAEVLKYLKKAAEERLNCKIKKAVVTVPAYFTDRQR